MKWLALLISFFVVACGSPSGRLVPYSEKDLNVLSRDETFCKNRESDQGNDIYLNCLRKLADNEGYWLLVARGNLQFVRCLWAISNHQHYS